MAESERPGPSRARPDRPEAAASPPSGLLTGLGVYGMRALEPVVLAADTRERALDRLIEAARRVLR